MTEQQIEVMNSEPIPELPREGWETLIYFQRHGRYDSSRPETPGQPTEEEQSRQGRLTAEGRVEAANRADERIDAALFQDPEHTDFLLINSPTFWLDDERLGQRARETVEIINERIRTNLAERGIDPNEHILNLARREDESRAFRGDEVSRPEHRVQEAQMFNTGFAQFLRDKFGGQGPDFWRAFYKDEFREERLKHGAPGPVEIANESNEVINIAARFANRYHQRNPDRKLVVWIVGHGDSTRPYADRVLGVPYDKYREGYNDGVAIAIDSSGHGTAVVSGRTYEVPLAEHGHAEPILDPQVTEE